MKRLEVTTDSSGVFQGMFEDPSGDYVECDKALGLLKRAREYLWQKDFGIHHNDVMDLINEIDMLD